MPWPQFEVDWKRAALVVVDMQNYGCNADVGLPQMLSERYPEIASYYLPRVDADCGPERAAAARGLPGGGLSHRFHPSRTAPRRRQRHDRAPPAP